MYSKKKTRPENEMEKRQITEAIEEEKVIMKRKQEEKRRTRRRGERGEKG